MTEENKPDVWDQIVSSATENNKESIVKEIEDVIQILEKRNEEKELLTKFKAVLKKIK